MTREELGALIADLSRFYLSGEMSGPAYARVVESLIATSGCEGDDAGLEDLAAPMASYAPGGGDGLFDDAGLRSIARTLSSG